MALVEAHHSSSSSHEWPVASGIGQHHPRDSVQALTFFRSSAEIYVPGDESGKLYQIEFGAVRIHRLLADGRRQISAFYLPGETFGLEADATHHLFAEAICATAVRIMRPPSSHNDTAAKLLPMALQTLARAQEHLLVLGRQCAAERVAAFIMDIAERQGDLMQMELPMSRQDIADYLGLTIETVSRVFTRFKQEGIVTLPTLRSVNIVKWQVLKNMAS